MTNAMTARHTQNPGSMRRPRATKNSRNRGCLNQLHVMRNPEIAKNPSTHTSLRSWRAGSNATRRPVNGHEWQRMTPVAIASRHAFSALLRGSNASSMVGLFLRRPSCRRMTALRAAETWFALTLGATYACDEGSWRYHGFARAHSIVRRMPSSTSTFKDQPSSR